MDRKWIPWVATIAGYVFTLMGAYAILGNVSWSEAKIYGVFGAMIGLIFGLVFAKENS
jgi:hypothetical protein